MLDARTLKRFAKPHTPSSLNHLYAGKGMWGDVNMMLFETPPACNQMDWATQLKDESQQEMRKWTRACTHQVWPVEVLANDDRVFVRFSGPDTADIWIQARYISTAIKRAGRNAKTLQFYTNAKASQLTAMLLEPVMLVCKYDLKHTNDADWNLKNEDLPTPTAYRVPDLDMAQVE